MKDRRERNSANKIATASAIAFGHRPSFGALVGGVLLWTAFPPLGWSFLAWFAPLPWLHLCRRPESPTRRDYWGIWFSAVLFWMVLLQGIRKAHPANNLGLCALSLYLAAYLPLFIAAVRQIVHELKTPLWIAAPLIWTAIEFVRGGLFTGFSVALLGHTQVARTSLIQISDVTGAYGVSFLMMLSAAALLELVSGGSRRQRFSPAIVAATALAMTWLYGEWRVRNAPRPADPPLQVALLQGTRDKVFEFNPEAEEKAFEQYAGLMERAYTANPNLDLIVWPEGAFSASLHEIILQEPISVPAGANISIEEIRQNVQRKQEAFAEKTRAAAAAVNPSPSDENAKARKTHLIVGVTTFELQGAESRNYNCALWIDPTGHVAGRYYKMHLVMFGEYVPFARYIPWLRRTPIGAGVTPGDRPASFGVNGYKLTPSICFESTVPHVIRRHVSQLSQKSGEKPDILVNITDDGWFWGSSILDLHLACAVFRAVELRRPLLIAANTGISAVVDGNGRVLDRLPHRREGFILVAVSRDGRSSFYERGGDVFAALCLIAVLVLGAGQLVKSRGLLR